MLKRIEGQSRESLEDFYRSHDDPNDERVHLRVSLMLEFLNAINRSNLVDLSACTSLFALVLKPLDVDSNELKKIIIQPGAACLEIRYPLGREEAVWRNAEVRIMTDNADEAVELVRAVVEKRWPNVPIR